MATALNPILAWLRQLTGDLVHGSGNGDHRQNSIDKAAALMASASFLGTLI
jgi:hypothetical protein